VYTRGLICFRFRFTLLLKINIIVESSGRKVEEPVVIEIANGEWRGIPTRIYFLLPPESTVSVPKQNRKLRARYTLLHNDVGVSIAIEVTYGEVKPNLRADSIVDRRPESAVAIVQQYADLANKVAERYVRTAVFIEVADKVIRGDRLSAPG
jgi:hypothetical protein